MYNLATRTGWYTANGVIAHNCLCFTESMVIVPMTEDASLDDPALIRAVKQL